VQQSQANTAKNIKEHYIQDNTYKNVGREQTLPKTCINQIVLKQHSNNLRSSKPVVQPFSIL